MDQYREYLAINVLNEGLVVSYRSLSRALKVHSNLAKQMLYDFHHRQTAKKPESVHATYLITGTRKPRAPTKTNGTQDRDGEDRFMQSSPFMSSMPVQADGEEEHIPVTSILLAKEEDLDDAKAQFDKITSIHVYSLEPGTLKDLQVLTDCNREITSKYASEDPLEFGKRYGTIQNPNVKRRTGRRPPPPTAPVASTAAAKAAPRPSSTAIVKEDKSAEPKGGKSLASKEDTSRKSAPQVDAAAIPLKNAAAKAQAPTLRREKSDIFKSFAKAKPKAKRQDTVSSTDTTPAPDTAEPSQTTEPSVEDEPMRDASEDEQEDDLVATPSTKSGASIRKAKKEREDQLRKMMDDDDEAMQDAPPAPSDESQDAPPDSKPASQASTAQEAAVVSGGRRRGRRRVMKKKTVKDEEGYLVTKDEPVWESFSEDEPVPEPKRPKVAAGGAKSNKGAARPGQGNIMSFFKKK